MANIKSNIKSIRKNSKRHARNKQALTASRSLAKKVRVTKDQKDLANTYKKLDSIASKGKIHKNKANRLKSRLALANNKKNKEVASTKSSSKK